jgi:hypothetical protein
MLDEKKMDVSNLRANHYCHSKCIVWGAVIIGTLVAVGLSFLLNLFGIAIGLSAFTTTADGTMSLAIGGFLGMLIGSIIVMFFAGWVTGYLGRTSCYNRHFGALYGLTTWCLALIVTLLLATSINAFISSSSRTMLTPQAAFTKNIEGPISSHINVVQQVLSDITSTATGDNKTTPAEKEAHGIGLSFALIFIIFFLSAAACCFGGYHGMKPPKEPRL